MYGMFRIICPVAAGGDADRCTGQYLLRDASRLAPAMNGTDPITGCERRHALPWLFPREAVRAVRPANHVAAVHRPHLRRSLWQLLGNALKYTEAGGTVTVTLQCQHQQVLLQVSDTGCGLGWACRWRGRAEVIKGGYRRHGGRLLLDSKVGQGTCVTLALPDQQGRTRCWSCRWSPRADYAGGFQAGAAGAGGRAAVPRISSGAFG